MTNTRFNDVEAAAREAATAPPVTEPTPPRHAPLRDEYHRIVSLLKVLWQDSALLVQQEVALAKAEMSEKAQVYGRNAAILAAGGAVAYAGLLCLLAAAIAGLTVALGNAMAWYHALWLSALIVGVIVVVVGAVMLSKAISTMKKTGVTPEQTVETLRENKQWLQHKVT